MVCNAENRGNAKSPIALTPLPIERLCRSKQAFSVFFPMVVTESGIVSAER